MLAANKVLRLLMTLLLAATILLAAAPEAAACHGSCSSPPVGNPCAPTDAACNTGYSLARSGWNMYNHYSQCVPHC